MFYTGIAGAEAGGAPGIGAARSGDGLTWQRAGQARGSPALFGMFSRRRRHCAFCPLALNDA